MSGRNFNKEVREESLRKSIEEVLTTIAKYQRDEDMRVAIYLSSHQTIPEDCQKTSAPVGCFQEVGWETHERLIHSEGG